MTEPQPRTIQEALEAGWTDEQIVREIIAQTKVMEADAWKILALEKGEITIDDLD